MRQLLLDKQYFKGWPGCKVEQAKELNKGVLFFPGKCFANHLQVNSAIEVIQDFVDPSANLIFGPVIDPSLNGQVSLFYSMYSLTLIMTLT